VWSINSKTKCSLRFRRKTSCRLTRLPCFSIWRSQGGKRWGEV
jgi:hypothetical protein